MIYFSTATSKTTTVVRNNPRNRLDDPGIQELQTSAKLVARCSDFYKFLLWILVSPIVALSRWKIAAFRSEQATTANRQPTMRENNRIPEISGSKELIRRVSFRVLSLFASTGDLNNATRGSLNSKCFSSRKFGQATNVNGLFWICWFNLESI